MNVTKEQIKTILKEARDSVSWFDCAEVGQRVCVENAGRSCDKHKEVWAVNLATFGNCETDLGDILPLDKLKTYELEESESGIVELDIYVYHVISRRGQYPRDTELSHNMNVIIDKQGMFITQ